MIELAMASWRMSPGEVLALTDEQFNSLICRLVERKARERAAYDRRDERTVSDSEALAELGIPVQEWRSPNKREGAQQDGD